VSLLLQLTAGNWCTENHNETIYHFKYHLPLLCWWTCLCHAVTFYSLQYFVRIITKFEDHCDKCLFRTWQCCVLETCSTCLFCTIA